jgi:hypothetical protein
MIKRVFPGTYVCMFKEKVWERERERKCGDYKICRQHSMVDKDRQLEFILLRVDRSS